MAVGTFDIRCSVVVLRKHAVLLLHRTRDGRDDWVLPGGTPREGESVTACARRELLEETGVSAGPSQVALAVEPAVPGSARRLLDIVFVATTEPALGREVAREPGWNHASSRRTGCPAWRSIRPSRPICPACSTREPGAIPSARYVGNVQATNEDPRSQA